MAPWNQAQARASALDFFMLSQTSSCPISFRKPPIKVSAVRGTASPVIGFLPSTAISRSQPLRALGQFGERHQDGVFDELGCPATRPLAKLMMPIDRLGEDPLGALPDTAKIEDVGLTQRIEELGHCLFDGRAGHAERLDLLLTQAPTFSNTP